MNLVCIAGVKEFHSCSWRTTFAQRIAQTTAVIERIMLKKIYSGLRTRWRLLTRPDRVTMHGATLRVLPDMPYRVMRSFYAQSYEVEEATILSRRLEAGDVVLECGGGVGYLSAMIAKRLGDDAVITYEANPALIDVIRENHKLTGVSPIVVNAALGIEARDEAVFHVSDRFAASSLMDIEGPTHEICVPMIEINRAVREAPITPNVLALDVEGFEVELLPVMDLTPFRKILLEVHPGIVGSESTASLLAHLRGEGFERDTEFNFPEVWFLTRT
jgi:FkbM family methyltransferase